MRLRSSGQKKTVLNTWERAAALLAATRFTRRRRRRSRKRSASSRKSRSREKTRPWSWAAEASNRMSSRSVRAREERPQERYCTASSKLVLPSAFSPQITLQTASKETVCSR
jgi:hypothetical protein